jgi:hypothetical protein
MRLGASAARREHDSTPGQFQVDRPLDSVQIDHALADSIVVDERDREAIGRRRLGPRVPGKRAG